MIVRCRSGFKSVGWRQIMGKIKIASYGQNCLAGFGSEKYITAPFILSSNFSLIFCPHNPELLIMLSRYSCAIRVYVACKNNPWFRYVSYQNYSPLQSIDPISTICLFPPFISKGLFLERALVLLSEGSRSG